MSLKSLPLLKLLETKLKQFVSDQMKHFFYLCFCIFVQVLTLQKFPFQYANNTVEESEGVGDQKPQTNKNALLHSANKTKTNLSELLMQP